MNDDTLINESTAATLSQIMALRLSRRDALKGVAAAGVYGLLGCAAPAKSKSSGGSSLTFTESGRFLDETHHVASGYNVNVLLRWGDPLHADAPAFNPQQQSAAAQERQFGANNDYIAFMPLPRGTALKSVMASPPPARSRCVRKFALGSRGTSPLRTSAARGSASHTAGSW
jgi:secreted PhoX family phosphatase